MNKIVLGLITLTISGIVFIACDSPEKSESITKNEDVALVEESYSEDLTLIERRFFDRNKKVFNATNAGFYEAVKLKNENVSHFAATMHGTIFLIELNDYPKSGEVKYTYGLLDQKGKTLLKTEYEIIGNPGFYGDQLIEIRKDGKFGLFNYVTKKQIDTKYDYLIPSNVKEYIAFGCVDGKMKKIRHDGEERDYRPSDNLIDFYQLFSPNLLAKNCKNWCGWSYAPELSYPDEYGTYSDMNQYLLFNPSFVGQLETFFKDRLNSNQEDKADLKISKKKEGSSFYSFVSDLYTMSTEARGAQEYESILYNVDKKTQQRKALKLFAYSEYGLQHCENGYQPSWKWRNDSVLEVREWNRFEEPKKGKIAETYYWALLIQKDGKVKSYQNGKFPLASLCELKAEHFKGCFIREATFEEFQQSDEFDPEMIDAPLGLYTNHLSISDLELMRNEIYARHGKEFTGKTQSYFKGQNWYVARSDYSEKDLTEIEKKNIILINQTISKVKKQGDLLLNPHVEILYEAG